MRFPVRIALSLLAVALSAASGCQRNTSVRRTIPADGESGVNPRTVIAIRVTNTFSDADVDNLDSANWLVTGDFRAEPYSGTITFAEWGRDVSPGQTIEDYEGSDSPVDGIEVDEEGEPIPGNVELRKDTLVFELADGESFQDGETISVLIKHDITARGTPIHHSKEFSFRVRGGDRSEEGLFVEVSDPAPGSTLVDPRPRMGVRFNRGVQTDGLAESIHVQGSQSGVHASTQLAVTATDAAGGALEIAVRLPVDDSFVPGEHVVLALESTALEAPQEDGTSDTTLEPYVTSFQIDGAAVEGGWSRFELPESVTDAVAVVAADVDLESAGTEVIIVSKGAIDLLRQTDDRSWESTETTLSDDVTAEGTFEPVAAMAYDIDSNGIHELVVLLTHADESRLQVFELDDSGAFQADGDPTAFEPGVALSLTAVDLDASGESELIVTFGPAEGGTADVAPRVFAVALAQPDPDSIDLTDPDSLLPRLAFVLQTSALPTLDVGRRMGVADLDGDGRLDLISETPTGLVLFQNLGTGRTPFAVRAVRTLVDPTADGAANSSAWVASDLDGDGDQEVLLWSDGRADAALFDGADGLLSEADPSATLLALGVAPQTALALDLDGAGRPDLAVAEEGGTVTLLTSLGDTSLVYERSSPVVAGGAPLALAAADVDGDSGIDLVSVAGDDVRFVLAEDVLLPDPEAVSVFRIASDLSNTSEQTLEIVVLGDFVETFTGYTLALDYDEELLTYDGFEAPEGLASLATFTPCPDASGAGCSGAAAVTMAYDRSRGAAIDNVVLGTFRFRLPEVTEAITTTIELMSFETDGASFSNTVVQSDGQASVTVAAAVDGEPFLVLLEPPAPPDLEAACSVVFRGDASLDGEITWTSPAGLEFDDFQILVGGQVETTLPGTATSYQFTTGLISTVPVLVRGLDANGASLATDECSVVGIHRPEVACAAITPSQNRVTWTLHAVDRFQVFRNGELVATLGGTTTQFIDDLASSAGSNVYEVAGFIEDIEGPRGSCDAVGDPDVGVTLPPEIVSALLVDRVATDAPNALRINWTNGEGYDSLLVTIDRLDTGATVVSEELVGTATEYLFEDDPTSGGVPPGEYGFSVTAFAGGVASEVAASGTLEVPVPTLAGNFLCNLTPAGDVAVIWDRVWGGYTALVLRVEQRIDGQLSGAPMEIELGLDESDRTLTGLAPIGAYSFSLVASYDLPLPAGLVPTADALTSECSLSFEPAMRLPTVVEGGVGASRIEIPVVADVEGTIEGFRFTLELPSFLTLDTVAGLETPFAGGSQTLELVADGDVTRATVTVTGISSAATLTGGERTLATLIASAPVDFELPEESAVRFVGLTTVEFPTLGDTRVDTEDSTLRMYRRFVTLERAAIEAGSNEAVELMVRGTLDAPAPGYHLLAFTIHVAWDPEEVELLPVSQSDQDATAGAGLGTFILPSGAVVAAANEAGDVAIPWFGLDFTNVGDLGFIEPGVDQPLLLLRFRSRLGADAGDRFLPIRFLIEDADRNPTAFVPEIDIPGQPNLQGALDGGIQLLASDSGEPLSVNALTPARGAFLGGGEATVTGTGFPTNAGALSLELLLPAPGTGTRVVAIEEILATSPQSIRFRLPDSGLRSPTSAPLTGDLRVTTGSEVTVFENAYTYEPPTLTAVNPASGIAVGGETIVIQGTGLPATSTVNFRAGGETVSAVVLSATPDGTELRVETPDLSGHAGETADIEVTVPAVGTVTLPGAFALVGEISGGPLELTSVVPAAGSICGGDEVVLAGQGFAANAQVFFGDVEAAGVVFLGGDRVRVTTPAVPEGTQAVDVVVTLGGAESATLQDGFTYEPDGPSFRRGDVDESGALTVTDAVLLSDLIFGRSTNFPDARDASDANDDGVVDQADISAILSVISGDVDVLPEPFQTLGLDPTPDSVTSCDG